MESNPKRCGWAENSFDLYYEYHDTEWGVPVHDEQRHFEFLILEGMQAGLSWATILKKRAAFRIAFDQFIPEKVALYTDSDISRLLNNAAIIRNKLKINAAIINAQKFLEVQSAYDGFDNYIWQFVEGKPIINHWKNMAEVPVTTEISDALSKDLKKRGFKFVGSTIMYAHMQAIGMVNDHTVDCFRHSQLS